MRNELKKQLIELYSILESLSEDSAERFEVELQIRATSELLLEF